MAEESEMQATGAAIAPPLSLGKEAHSALSRLGPDLSRSQRPRLWNELVKSLAPEYELGKVLGQGAFGVVFRAHCRATGQDVAIKALRAQEGGADRVSRVHLARFEREAALSASLCHPNIVRLLGNGRTDEGLCYAVFEFVPGETLRSKLSGKHGLSAPLTSRLMGQALDALSYAHARGIVHRDFKPENLMVASNREEPHCKVLDFGIGTWIPEARGREFESLTLTREAVGTPSYSAPEQLRGEPPTTKSDLYAWGLVLLECLTGQPVIFGATLAEIYQQHLSPNEIRLPPRLAAHPISALLRRVLRKKPSERAGDATSLYNEFSGLTLPELNPGGRLEAGDLASVTQAAIGVPCGPELRQLTVLACELMLVPSAESELEFEVLDAIYRDQLSFCRDELRRFGGVLAAEGPEQQLAYFGYPQASDTDARRAARTAFELAERLSQRSARLSDTQGVALVFRLGLHTGMVLTDSGEIPTGITPGVAVRLANVAPENGVLVSDSTRRLLENRMDFESFDPVQVNGQASRMRVFRLLSERQAEALGFQPSEAASASFFGREAELALLRSRWTSLQAGEGGVVLISGEPGIGKSRLLSEFLQHLPEAFAPMLCRCSAEQQNVALAPILELLRERLGLRSAGSPREAAGLLADVLEKHALEPDYLLPIFCTWFSLPRPEGYSRPDMSSHRQRELLLSAIAQMLPRLDGDRPRLLAIEDLHWADLTTLEFLARIARGPDRNRMLVVVTSRLDASQLEAIPDLEQLELRGLAAEQSSQLVHNLLPPEFLATEVEREILQRADGVPLFLEELVRIISEDQRQALTVSSGQRERTPIPITLRDLLAERLDRLGSARATAQLAAALGRDFEPSLLLAVSPEHEAQVDANLETLLAANILYLHHRLGASAYGFRHALIRDAAYQSMPRELRRRNHARIAECLSRELRAPSNPAEIGRHYAAAGQYAEAAPHGLRAAQILLERSANAEALAQASAVLAWIEELAPEGRNAAELEARGIAAQALMAIDGWGSSKVREQAERSRALLPNGAAQHHTVATLFALFMHYHVTSARADCRGVANELTEFATAAKSTSLQAVAATAQGVRCHAEGRFGDAAEHLEQALLLYDPERDREQGAVFGQDCRAWALAQLALVQWTAGSAERAFELSDQSIAWSRQIQHIPSLGIALLYRSQLHQLEGDRLSALRSTAELLELASTYGLPAFEGYAAAIRAWAENDFEAVNGIVQTLERMNCRLILTYYGSYLAEIELCRGQYRPAIRQLERCLALCEELDEHCFEPELHRRWALCELLDQTPRVELVRSSLERAVILARELCMLRFEALALRDLERVFGSNSARSTRLAEIVRLRPELGTLGVSRARLLEVGGNHG